MIEPDIDIYGGLARGSALADYLELLSLTGKRCTRSQLEDAVKDKYWSRKRRHMIVDAEDLNEDGEYDDEEVELMSHVEEAFACLDERADILRDRYPFELDGVGVTLKSGVTPREDVYVAYLCLTAAHAYGIATPTPVTELFEDVVTAILESRGLLLANIGDISRTVKSTSGTSVTWPETLKRAGKALNIPTVLSGAPFLRHANDMGADAVAHMSWFDGRRGRWTFVCQITCGDSDSWRRKLSEAAPGLWAGWFQEVIDPLCALAVPHHVPPRTQHLLVQEHRKLLLDRLRLVLARPVVSVGESEVVDSVLTAGVENVAAA